MKPGLSWILVAALLISLGLLLLPAPKPVPQQEADKRLDEEELPELRIMTARLRAFAEDGTTNWSMRSPQIVYHLDGSLDVASPHLLMHSASGATLRAQAGKGSLQATADGEQIELYAKVDAVLRNHERQVALVTESLLIARDGRSVSAPNSVQVRSDSVDTSAANLALNLEEQILLLGATQDERVHTRIQPEEALQ